MSSDVVQLVRHLESLGLSLRPDGTDIIVAGNTSRLTVDAVAQLRARKTEVIELLTGTAHAALDAALDANNIQRCSSCAHSPECVFIDFETRSSVSLDSVGGRVYAEHPATEILCVVARLPSGRLIEWCPKNPPPADLFINFDHRVFVAHNADGYDRFIWARLGWPRAQWLDTLPLARLVGLPGALDALGELVGVKKDLEGRKFTLQLGRIDPRTGLFPVLTASDRDRVKRYCARDVEVLHSVWHGLLDRHRALDSELRRIDTVVNERGFAFDAALARAVIDCCGRIVASERKSASVDATVLASPKKLTRFLCDAGIHVRNVRRETLEEILENPDLADDIRRVLVARLALSNIAAHKLTAALMSMSTDGRVRDTLVFAAAHTGRWSGRRFQPQNLPRGVTIKNDVDAVIERLVHVAVARDVVGLGRAAAELDTTVHDTIATLVRACVAAPGEKKLAVVDYSSIEARALAWLAGDEDAIVRFRRNEDPYAYMASILFRVPVADVTPKQRLLGKVLVLGCGYQMGVSRFEAHAANSGVDWEAVDVTPATAVDAWRDAHPSIAGTRWQLDQRKGRTGGLWNNTERAALTAMTAPNIPIAAGRTTWRRHGPDLVCILPSKRPLVYRSARVEARPTPWGKSKQTLTYERFGGRVTTYGGKLVENITQAVCRDLLGDALVRLDAQGIAVVLHVHDEVVAEISREDEHAAMVATMSTAPAWAEGLPLAVKSYVAKRYRK